MHSWSDECVVHHALSNDTYRLAGVAGRILIELAAAAGRGASRAGELAFDDPATLEILGILADLDLVQAC